MGSALGKLYVWKKFGSLGKFIFNFKILTKRDSMKRFLLYSLLKVTVAQRDRSKDLFLYLRDFSKCGDFFQVRRL